MKRFLTLVLISSILTVAVGNAAQPKISVKPLKLVTTFSKSDGTAGFIAGAKTIILFGTDSDRSFARALDSNGQELWRVELAPNSSSIATAGAVDSGGNIWIAGATSLAQANNSAVPSTTSLNPDNVADVPEITNTDLNVIALWKIPNGTSTPILYTVQQATPVLITDIAVDENGLSLVGITQSTKGSQGFVIGANPAGEFSKPILVGASSTTLDAVVRHSDGGLTVTGASSETLGGKKLVGVIDGVIVKISNKGTITQVVRSSAVKAQRNWNTATSTFLLGGTVVTGKKIESAITKFSSTYVPTWSYKFASNGPAKTAGSTYVIFESIAPIPQLTNWAPKKPQPLLLSFNSKGLITAAFNAPNDQREVIELTSSKELGLLCMTANSDSYSIYSLA